MGLLDELQSEVKKIKEDDLKQNAELKAQEEFYLTQLQPAMVRAYEYFSELVENLNIVAPDVRPAYPIGPRDNHQITLRQGDYEFDFDHVKKPRVLRIYCSCTLERPLEFHVPTKEAVLKHTELLERYGAHFNCKNHLDKHYNIRAGTFLLEGPVKVRVQILANATERCIEIDFRNLEDQPQKHYKFPPESIDNDFLDRLARVLTRDEEKLVEVQVSDQMREDLRRQVEADKKRSAEKLAQDYAYIANEKIAEEEAKLINRTKRAMAEGVDRVSGLLGKLK